MGAQITQGLGNAWSLFATFVPKLIAFLVILLVGWLIAKAIAKAIGFVLQRVGFPKLVEKSGLSSMMGGFDPTTLIVKLIYYFILLLALQVAFGAFGPSNPVSVFLNEIIGYLPRVVVALVLVLIAAAIARVLRNLVTGALGQRPIAGMTGTITYVFVLALGIIAALGQLEIATTVITPLLVTVLATVGGVIVVGAGGGLIQPMRHRWDGWLDRLQAQNGAAGQEVTAGAGRQGIQGGGQHYGERSGQSYTGHLGSASDAPTPPGGIGPMPTRPEQDR
ncbi:MAG TPA: hypothetical protein VG317_12320 [Pseudonocardiaceae bacterium]|jgi:hypothetical protein|nr:hypothetical protein [Pseudonocardiaceae bacterium]